jgi:hypothetical protein
MHPIVRAKFKVESKKETKHWDKQKPNLTTVELSVVTGGSPENQRFFDSTPGGRIEMSSVSKDVADRLVLGEEYYIDFVPTKEPEPAVG